MLCLFFGPVIRGSQFKSPGTKSVLVGATRGLCQTFRPRARRSLTSVLRIFGLAMPLVWGVAICLTEFGEFLRPQGIKYGERSRLQLRFKLAGTVIADCTLGLDKFGWTSVFKGVLDCFEVYFWCI